MDNILLEGSIILVFHLFMTMLSLAILSSLIVKRKVAGSIFLVYLLAIGFFILKSLYSYSPIICSILVGMYVCLGIATYFNVKRKLII
ncbi:hypothetical protein NST63_09870 [Heyndrickxia sp. FSL W8-0496]|uniref:hypothetical protein n=1 Tax=Heyndrickxia TaxID=2837504 RepID=UPI0030F7C3E6